MLTFQIDGVQIAVKLKSESLLSKADLTVGDFVPMTPSGLNRDRSLSELLDDSAGRLAPSPVLQPIKIYSQDSDDDDVIVDDISDDDVIVDDIELEHKSKLNILPAQPIRPGPPPKPKRSPHIVDEDLQSEGKHIPVKAKPERPKPFSKTASPAGSPSSKRKLPPSRPGKPASLLAGKSSHPHTEEVGHTAPSRRRATAVGKTSSAVTKPVPPQRPTVETNSLNYESEPLPSQGQVEKSTFHESRPAPPARPVERLEKQWSIAVTDKPTTPPRGNSFTVEKNAVDHESKPVLPARSRSDVQQPMEGVEKPPVNKPSKPPPRPASLNIEKSALDKPTTPARPKVTAARSPARSVTPPQRPVTAHERSSPPSASKHAISKEKEVSPCAQGIKEVAQVREPEGLSLRKRLGSLKLPSRKQQREEVLCIIGYG